MRPIKFLLFFFLLFTACKEKTVTEIRYTNLPPKTKKIKINWLTDKTVNIKTIIHLSYVKGFECDSVIGFNYIGFEGEHFYFPINEKGQYISTIKQTQKLSQNQISRLNSIIRDKKTYENPDIAGCYEPRLAFVYFKDNSVICQTQICLDCNQLQSSAVIADGADGNLNKEAVKEITELQTELGFTKN
ncbi:hypothetical protein [Flavobacterium panacagri]|uniref:hypothetical protein n=1 Tax=Flavobacterium panacagri TaxID=3034146 RepID=UPI0025A68433|nr:hypothetical protein [Flavobacterium panacagri]